MHAQMHRSPSIPSHARSLDIPTTSHVNRMAFSGVLAKIDEPSDAAPEGSGGRRIMLTMSAAKHALESLLGMGVNFCPTGHAPQQKIGIISAADIIGSEIQIKGVIYSADFPEIAEEIKANKSKFGLSFEAMNVLTSTLNADILPIEDLAFTGAAILLRDNAAYRCSSISIARVGTSAPSNGAKLNSRVAAPRGPLQPRVDCA
jgi:hypothetical protein